MDYVYCFLASKHSDIWILEEVLMETVLLWISQKRFFLSSCKKCSEGPGEFSWLRYASNFRDGRAEKTSRGISRLWQNPLMCPWVTGKYHSEIIFRDSEWLVYPLWFDTILVNLCSSLHNDCRIAITNPSHPHQKGSARPDGESEYPGRASDQEKTRSSEITWSPSLKDALKKGIHYFNAMVIILVPISPLLYFI